MLEAGLADNLTTVIQLPFPLQTSRQAKENQFGYHKKGLIIQCERYMGFVPARDMTNNAYHNNYKLTYNTAYKNTLRSWPGI